MLQVWCLLLPSMLHLSGYKSHMHPGIRHLVTAAKAYFPIYGPRGHVRLTSMEAVEQWGESNLASPLSFRQVL